MSEAKPKKSTQPRWRGGDIASSQSLDPQWTDYRKRLIGSARDGDLSCAFELIDTLIDALRSNEPLPPELRDYLIDALNAVDCVGPENAFHLKRLGRPRSAPERDLAVVALVTLKMRELCKAGVDADRALPKAKERALLDISALSGMAFDTRRIEQILAAYHRDLELDEVSDPLLQLGDVELAAVADISELFARPKSKGSAK
jgi:hypothetical protein